MKKSLIISIVGLGYVGLPLAVEFGKKYNTIAYDINQNRINELLNGLDSTGEITKRNLQSSIRLSITNKLQDLSSCNVFIISVPTPIAPLYVLIPADRAVPLAAESVTLLQVLLHCPSLEWVETNPTWSKRAGAKGPLA